MNGSIAWKAVLSAAVVAWAALNLIPWQDTPFEEYVLAEVSAQADEFEEILERAHERVEENPDDYPSVYMALRRMAEEERLDLARYFPHIDLRDQRNINRRNEILMDELLRRSQGEVRLGLDLRGGVSVTFQLDEEAVAGHDWEREALLEQAIEVIAGRVDGLGVAEPIIRSRGESQIEVQMPGITTRDNPDIVDVIGAPALLEFSLLHRTADPRTAEETPIGYRRMVQEFEDPETGDIIESPVFVRRVPMMTGEIITEARAVPGEFGGHKVVLSFTREGERQFARHTREIAEENERTGTIGQLAIILDGELYSAPTVRREIRGGAEITGRFSQREAMELANVLNNPLQVGLEPVQLSEVGPTLAADARSASINAALLGASLVVVFMLIYYRLGGFVAMFTVILNLTIVVGTLSSFGATITLPGVAALVLTIGMAVDANILIFERIREERKLGKTLPTALESGYNKAFSTIVDANVTTLITALILVWLGTGPVKGFGVTLAVGILSTMFCSLIVNRWMLELFIRRGIIRNLFTGQVWKERNIPFLNYARRAFTASWVVVAIGIVAFFFHFDRAFGIDFTGGDEITVAYDERISPLEIAGVAEANDFGEVNAIYQSIIGAERETIKIQTPPDRGSEFYDLLNAAYPNAGLDLTGETRIGAAVGAAVRRSAVASVVVALMAMLLYIAIRFEWGYGFGGVVATIHDVLMTIGLFIALGEFFGIGSGQFSAPMIAAILMVVGYSINDTIVVFDRIREELDLNPGMDLKSVVHLAINRTLSRTILTSTTTLLATFSLFIFGAGIITDFSLVFIIGILTGTFSSIFIASPVFFWYHKGDRRKVEERHLLPSYEWSSQSSTKKTPTPKPAAG